MKSVLRQLFRALTFALIAFCCANDSVVCAKGSDPTIVEFGPTFRSTLGDVVVGADGAIWVSESDGVARVTRDGRVTDIRRPDDCSQENLWPIVKHCEAQTLHVGPQGAVWMNGDDRLLRFTESSVTQVDVGMQIHAVAATEDGVYASRRGESGLRLIEPDGHEIRLLASIGEVAQIVARPDGALWLVVQTKRAARSDDVPSLALFSPKHLRVDRALRVPYLVTHDLAGHFAVAPDGGLIADFQMKSDPRKNNVNDFSIAHIDVHGSSDVLATIPYGGGFPEVGGLAVAGNGTVWFTQPGADRIGRIDSDGSVRIYHDRLPPGTTPTGIAVDADSTVWYTDPARATIGHLMPATGAVGVFGNGLSPLSRPAAPVVSGDGALWFIQTYTYHRRITRLAPDGTVREVTDLSAEYSDWLKPQGRCVSFYYTPFQLSHVLPRGPARVRTLEADGNSRQVLLPACAGKFQGFTCLFERRQDRWLRSPSIFGDSLTLGPDSNLWFADYTRIARLSRNGRIDYFSHGLTRWQGGPKYITVGPDRALWFTGIHDRIGRITLDGKITEFAAGIPFRSFVGGIVTGPDGNLWFTLYHGNELARITPAGVVTRFRHGIYPSRGNDYNVPDSIPFVDHAGNIWFNEPQGGRVAQATLH